MRYHSMLSHAPCAKAPTRQRGGGVLAALALLVVSLLAACATSQRQTPQPNPAASTATAQAALAAQMQNPVVDPEYIYSQLAYMATHFQHREAGYDSNPAGGHDAFATYWTHEITDDLQGFGPHVRRDEFQTTGWDQRPPTVPAVNVEVSVPGVTRPDQVVIVGCHYDGEAISTQSAYDDASGCAIELGIARAMAAYWRTHHVYPARTLRFVIFDAEEQGLIGSLHYVNQTVNGDLANIVAMFNEEQNGINYPVRYLGYASNPLIPYIIDLAQQQETPHTRAFEALVQRAIGETFAQFRALGMRSLDYRTRDGKLVSQQVFTPDQTNNLDIKDGALGGSDELPFILDGVTQATFGSEGDTYPFDTSQDTIALMNVFASGGSHKAMALVYALAIPAGLTTWMLNQSAVLGAAAAPAGPLAAIGDVGQTVVGQPTTFDARDSFDPTNPNATLSYSWNFGDGGMASGVSVSHTYATMGAQTVTLVVRSSSGSVTVRKSIHVVSAAPFVPNLFPRRFITGNPGIAPGKLLPTPDPRIGLVVAPAHSKTAPSAAPGPSLTLILALMVALLALAGGGTALLLRRRLALSGARPAQPLSADDEARQRRREVLRRMAEQQAERTESERRRLP